MTHVVRISNKKRGWTVFQIMGTLGGAFFVFMGCMLMINLLKDPHNDVARVIVVSGFIMALGIGLWGAVVGTALYLKKKRAQFITAFMADEATKIYSDREGAAYELWLWVKKFTQTEPLWSKYTPVYNGYWLQKFANMLEEYK
jgi:amino acid transporter